tara:strand:+ start:2682 stop:4541 length:1860 start_codon:yes stop_codon:yes gene_type:complete
MRISFNIVLKFIFTAIAVIVLSCESQEPISLPEADRSPPTALIIYPPEYAVVSGNVTIQIHATDNDKVDSVLFLVNQDTIGSDDKGENDIFESKWATSDYQEDVYHSLSFIAFDRTGNTFRPYPIQVKSDNTDDIKPEAEIINPFMGAIVSGIVPIIINATDNDSVEYVRIYINNILQGYVTEPPYTFAWNTNLVQDGNYSIYAVATDLTGNETTVTPIIVTTDNGNLIDTTPPSGVIIYPASGTRVSGDINITVHATDNSGNMGRVEFFIDGTSVNMDMNEPFEYTWDTTEETEDEDHVISITLEDPSGNSAVLNPITVFVDNHDNDDTPPVVTITAPTAGQQVSGIVTISAFAEDDQGIGIIEIFINGERECIDLSPPNLYDDCEWDTETEDDDQYYIIGVTVHDTTGNTATATPITVYVDNIDNEPPTGQIITPWPGQVVSDTVIIEISATDNEGIESVEISIDANVLSIVSESPYQYEWDTGTATEDQDHVISALITDLSNNTTYVDPVSVFVDNQDPEDTTPPIAVISHPLSGQTVSGTVAFTVMAQDDIGIASVEFFIDGSSTAVESTSTSTYTYNWNTTGLENNSQHTLSAQVTDTSNNTTLAQPIMVIVTN